MKRAGPFTLAIAIVLLGAVLRFWALDTGLPHPMSRPDEEAVLDMTARPARGEWALGWAVYPSAYIYAQYAWGALVLHGGSALGLVPPEGYGTTLRVAPARALLAGRTLSAVAGTATVAVVMAAAWPALGPRAALVAGTLVATNFLHARDSHFLKPDALLALAVVMALWALERVARKATRGRVGRAGAAIALAMGVKYPAVLLAVPGAVACWAGTPPSGAVLSRGRAAFRPLAAMGVVTLLVFVATNPFLVFDPGVRDQGLAIVRLVFPQFFPAAPDLPRLPSPPWYTGVVKHATFSFPYGAGHVATVLGPLAAAAALVRREPIAVLSSVFGLTWVAVHMASLQAVHARYMTPVMPVLSLLLAALVSGVVGRGAGRGRDLAAALLCAGLIAEPLGRIVAHDRIAARTDTRVLATDWMATHLPATARIAIVGTQFWVWGLPQMPPGVRQFNVELTREALAEKEITHVLTHDHVLFSSQVDWPAVAALGGRLELLQEWDPFTADGRSVAVFEPMDAYYIPFAHFEGVVRPGPRIRLYAFH